MRNLWGARSGGEPVCLLIVLSRVRADLPLVVAANRDELFERPALAMTVLQEGPPRVLGGRDLKGGGTWLAVNEHGLVAALTNRPAAGGPVPARRSRGELALALARHGSAVLAAGAFATSFHARDFNPAWLLVGDREALFYIDMTVSEGPVVRPLAPGVHILENRPLDAGSAKVEHVRGLLSGAEDLSREALLGLLRSVLADHRLEAVTTEADGDEERPVEVSAACVHSERYGTRWSGLVSVGADRRQRPEVLYADGPPCLTRFVQGTSLWSEAQPPESSA